MELENLARIVELADSLHWEDGYYIEIRNGQVHAGRNPEYGIEVRM